MMKNTHIERKSRETVFENYEPVVLWVKPSRFTVEETGQGTYSIEEVLRRKIRVMADDHPMIEIPELRKEPDVFNIKTEFGEK